MAATVTLTCPECDKQMKTSAEVLGKKVRCKGCGATFAARESSQEEEDTPPARTAPGKKAPAAKKPAPRKAAPPASKPPDAPIALQKDDEEDDAKLYGVNTDDLSHRCPNCANAMESEDAVICLHCGYDTVKRTRSSTRKVRDQTGGDYFFWLLPGIACAIGVLLILTFDIVYCLRIEDWVDKDAWYSFLTSLGVKIWIVVPSLFVMFGLGKFAFRRLALDYKPPEIEEKLL